ncbi:MAG TPA: sensor histidine kinase [Candidatus Acidoferrum sp.]|nr:sensor histidine kinase [Candidatus Acidoferrum sp.]
MEFQTSHRRIFERQLTFARPIIILLALLALLDRPLSVTSGRAFYFLLGYLLFSVALVASHRLFERRDLFLPLVVDLAALLFFLYVSPSLTAVWFPFLYVAFAAGGRWGSRAAVFLLGALSLALVFRAVIQGELHLMHIIGWLGLLGATFAAGVALALLGDLSRRAAAENDFLTRITTTLQVDQGLAESFRLFLDELARAFDAAQSLIVFRDLELERIFLWRVVVGQTERISPENLPLARADGFLLDDMDADVCWNSLEGPGQGFGWDRRNGRRIKFLPHLPGPSQHELQVRSLMTVAFDQSGQPAGRLFVVNPRRPCTRRDLRWLDRIARHFSAPAENLFLLRHMRARAIEGERSRISRDLHDGILQTLLSIEIQLDVLRRRLPVAPDQAVAGLAALQQTVKNESAELRALVTDLRPLRVQSADLVDLMRGHAERLRNESFLALELLIDSTEIEAPDHVCRELFQIYREALSNVKKHAKASHVVVKLTQDDSRIILVVDDDGEGFSFAGQFSGDELDRLRLGPISIKERTRAVGGMLTVESSPGHGARVTVEIPLA